MTSASMMSCCLRILSSLDSRRSIRISFACHLHTMWRYDVRHGLMEVGVTVIVHNTMMSIHSHGPRPYMGTFIYPHALEHSIKTRNSHVLVDV